MEGRKILRHFAVAKSSRSWSFLQYWGVYEHYRFARKIRRTEYDLIKCTASLVAAYVSRNAVGVGELPILIDQVHTAISVLQGGGVRLDLGLDRSDGRTDRGLDPARTA